MCLCHQAQAMRNDVVAHNALFVVVIAAATLPFVKGKSLILAVSE